MDVEKFRKRLVEIERDLVNRIGREVEDARETNDEAPDDAGDLSVADEVTDEYLTEASTNTVVLEQVRAALRRIEAGTFGRCVVDGGPIEEKRLEAVPWTPYCVRHQQEIDAAARTPTL